MYFAVRCVVVFGGGALDRCHSTTTTTATYPPANPHPNWGLSDKSNQPCQSMLKCTSARLCFYLFFGSSPAVFTCKRRCTVSSIFRIAESKKKNLRHYCAIQSCSWASVVIIESHHRLRSPALE